MSRNNGAKVGELIENLINNQLPENVPIETKRKYHAYFSRLLSSQTMPSFAHDINDTVAKMNDRINDSDVPRKTERMNRLHECLTIFSSKRNFITKKWSVLRVIYKLADQDSSID